MGEGRSRMKAVVFLALAACLLLACDDDSSDPVNAGPYRVVLAFPNLTFSRPTNIENAGDGTNRLFVTEQTGRILVFPNDISAGAATVFLDISIQVNYEEFSELGLIGLAFHPDYENNGYFFVHYSTGNSRARRGRVSRFQVGANANVADPSSERVLLDWADRYANHNGGRMCFGTDGYLYIGLGDEGGAGDLQNNAQDRSQIFGKILRIDVDQNVDTEPYHGIPPDNPYVGNSQGFRQEIWAYGFRNPWRISFDAPTGRLIASDVGQRTWEEIDFVEKGGNYGWDCREGRQAFQPGPTDGAPSPLCAFATGLQNPVFVYGRSEGGSITGGYVYRGPSLADLHGRYVFGDFNTGRIWALNALNTESALLVETGMFISTFGVAEDNELLVGTYFADGTPSRIYLLRPI
jgi:glucose/arabinose dehydrogenase